MSKTDVNGNKNTISGNYWTRNSCNWVIYTANWWLFLNGLDQPIQVFSSSPIYISIYISTEFQNISLNELDVWFMASKPWHMSLLTTILWRYLNLL